MWRAIKLLWRGVSTLSTLQWLLGLLPAGAGAVITGLVGRAEHLPPVIVAVLAITVAAAVYVSYVALLLQRRQETIARVRAYLEEAQC